MEDPFISFMIWKGAILIGIAGVIAFWEGYTGKKLFSRENRIPTGTTNEADQSRHPK
jgi:hypothetical protein